MRSVVCTASPGSTCRNCSPMTTTGSVNPAPLPSSFGDVNFRSGRSVGGVNEEQTGPTSAPSAPARLLRPCTRLLEPKRCPRGPQINASDRAAGGRRAKVASGGSPRYSVGVGRRFVGVAVGLRVGVALSFDWGVVGPNAAWPRGRVLGESGRVGDAGSGRVVRG